MTIKSYPLDQDATLTFQQGDITQCVADAIVNAANERMLGGGGVDGAIHRAAGPELQEACRAVKEVRPGVRCPTGEARITPGFQLPSQFVIHTVGPIYTTASESAPLLESAYRSSLRLANEHRLRSILFPAISCGVFGYPADEAAAISVRACLDHRGNVETVGFVLFDQRLFEIFVSTAQSILKSTS